ncbi:MAG: hypothetical protein Q9209_006469 [Squamulea sp. 1 TL-2023]
MWDGNCRFGINCRFSHDPTTPCYFFQSQNGCRKGNNCFFLHQHTSSGVNQAPASSAEPDYETRFREWTYLIPRGGGGRRSNQVPDITTFFKIGRDLLASSDAGGQQKLIKKLASEEGLAMIKSLTEVMNDEILEDREVLSVFQRAAIPLFQTLAHPGIISSLVLEHAVDTIYNFLYGSGGRRGAQVLHFSAKAISLMVIEDDSDGEQHKKRSTVLKPFFAVLERLVELNQGALLQQDFIPTIGTISACVDTYRLLPESRRSLDKIRLRLGLGALIPSATTNTRAVAQKAAFKFHHDLPGALSSDGPRHDNDHEQIKDIQILPTVEEISCPRLEYLPFNNATNNHLSGLPGLLDRQFRLLREDAIGGLRDAVKREAERLEMGSFQAMSPNQRNQERTYVHEDLRLRHWEVDRRKGLQLVADFAQPAAISKSGPCQRKEWWDGSRRLQPTSLVCMVSSTGQNMFCLVCDPTPTPPSKIKQRDDDRSKAAQSLASEKEYERKKKEMPSLHKDDNRAAVMLTLLSNDPRLITWISRIFTKGKSTVKMSLVEFPGVLLPAFQPTLLALQEMSQRLDVPFTDLLSPLRMEAGARDVPPPMYTLHEDFAFDLSPLSKGEPLTLSIHKPFDRQDFDQYTSLDEAQQAAVVHALKTSLALVQGPPGTGKSYTGVSIIKVLLHNRKSADLGPIICVCYTNHALDQLLEHLVQDGIEQIVRIGSRSKSELLQNVNLHDLVQQIPPTKDEGYEKYLLNQQLSSSINEIENLLRDLNTIESEDRMKVYLEEYWPSHFEQLFESDMLDDGFTIVTRRNQGVIGLWLRSAAPDNMRNLPVVELLELPLNGMSVTERWRLHAYWFQEHAEQLGGKIERALKPYQDTRSELDTYYKEQQRRALSEAHVIGVTTSGLAKNLDVLRRLQSKVMICEEAGEVLEAHTLTALLPSVEHAILIGDHEQLRPQVKSYDLCHDNPRGKYLALDISLFERLINPEHDLRIPPMPFSRLKVQRRMFPTIADLIRGTLYLDLEDHPTVQQYPIVHGMKDRLFWLTHNNQEDGANPSQAHSDSKSNDFEVRMVSALASHLTRQGTYAAGEIAVLTPYVRQLQKIRRSLGDMFEIVLNERDVQALEEQENVGDQPVTVVPPAAKKTKLLSALRAATIDNFQGEEAKVVILSYVRSNAEGKCGFLRTTNRINVALSRAQHGMYIIGNAQTASSVPMWAEIISILQSRGSIGDSLALCCPRHPDDAINVKSPDDFAIFSPEGGCNKRCSSRLPCGHACPNKCHSEALHLAVRCLERCSRVKDGCDHECPNPCGDPCDKKCKVAVANVELPCGHQSSVPCYHAQHPELVRCQVKVLHKMSECGHEIMIRCGEDPVAGDLQFMIAGAIVTETSHAPYVMSLAKYGATTHAVLNAVMNLVFLVWRIAHGPVPMGSVRCRVLSRATACPARSVVPSSSCVDIDALQSVAKLALNPTLSYEEIDLDVDPCVFPSCGHIITRENLDQHMEMKEFYDYSVDLSGRSIITAAKNTSQPLSISVQKSCPACRTPIRNVHRYGRIARRAWIDEATKKFIVWANAGFVPMAARMRDVEEQLQPQATDNDKADSLSRNLKAHFMTMPRLSLNGSSDSLIRRVANFTKNDKRYQNAFRLRTKILLFIVQVDEKEQPFTRIYDLVQDAKRHKGIQGRMEWTPDVLQTRNRLLATVLLLRCEYTIVANFLSACKGHAITIKIDFQSFFKACESLIKDSGSKAQLANEVEGHLFWARFMALQRGMSDTVPDGSPPLLMAREHLHLAKEICTDNPGQTAGMLSEVEDTEKALRDSTFYTSVTNEEKAAIYAAMASDFRGTGHWYYCQGGHLFTIGECGMPMETSRCPQCGAAVGGQSHRAVQGVTRAADMDEQFGRLQL